MVEGGNPVFQGSGQGPCFRTVEEDRFNVYSVLLNFRRDGDAGVPYSSMKLIETGFGQADPMADLVKLVLVDVTLLQHIKYSNH